ncbi:hypothetical protein KO489_02950, partial [Reinekea forsetii]|nr:hypothetical protein [Reinekea forsetii]
MKDSATSKVKTKTAVVSNKLAVMSYLDEMLHVATSTAEEMEAKSADPKPVVVPEIIQPEPEPEPEPEP